VSRPGFAGRVPWVPAGWRGILRPLSRLVAAVILTVFFFQAAGVALAAGAPCAQQCEDDGPDGRCAPTCVDCICCGHPRATFARPPSMIAPSEAKIAEPFVHDGDPPQTDLKEIVRIPKRNARLADVSVLHLTAEPRRP
jgi:hypothetical protein